MTGPVSIGAIAGGWLLIAAAVVVALLAPGWQLGFAAVAIGGIGMAHGASDLAIVPSSRRAVFLGCYGAVSLACLWWWSAHPAVALPLFLLASAIHFGLEDAPADAPVERIMRGVGLVAAPAVVHRASLGDLLMRAGAPSELLPTLVDGLAIAGAIAAAGLLLLAARRRDTRLAMGVAALLLLPPLVGFGVGFLVLHALPQTVVRRDQLGCATMHGYLRAVAPVLLSALAVAAGVAAVMMRADPSGIRPLFAAIAALAMPHLLVTPWFGPRATAPGCVAAAA